MAANGAVSLTLVCGGALHDRHVSGTSPLLTPAGSPMTTTNVSSTDPPPVTESRRQAWVITAMLVVLMLINWGDKSVLGLAAVPISEDFGLSHTEYGFISSSFFFLFSASSILVGLLAMRVNVRRILLVIAVAWSIFQLPILVGMGTAGLLISRIGLGAAEGPTSSMTVHAVHDWFPPQRRGVPTALTQIGGGLGLAVAAPTLSYLIIGFGWKSAFVALTVVGLVWAVVWFCIARDGPYSAAASRNTVPGDTAPGDTVSGDTATAGPPIWRIFTRPTWWGGLLSGFVAYWALSLIAAWLPTYLEKGLGYSAAATGSLLIVPPVVGVLSQLGGTMLSDRLLRRGVRPRFARGLMLAGTGLVSGVCVLVFPHVSTPWLAFGLLAVGLGAPGATFPLGQLVAAEISPVRKRSAVLGWTVGLVTTAGLVAPAITGRLIDAAPDPGQGYVDAWTLAGVLLVAGALIAAVTIDPRRDARALGIPAA